MDINVGLRFKLDGEGDLHEVKSITKKKILEVNSPKLVHIEVIHGNQRGKKSQGSPVDLDIAELQIKNGFWVVQQK
jgi:hypothetical protein